MTTQNLNIIDFGFLHHVVEHLKRTCGAGDLSFENLQEVLAAIREENGMPLAETTLAFVPIDRNSKAQQRFLEALQKFGYTVIPIDFRDTYVSSSAWNGDKPAASLAPWISYTIGVVSKYDNANIVVVSGSFDNFFALSDFTENRKGQAVMAFFRSYLDRRWNMRGLPDGKLPIKFYDLEDDGLVLFGTALKETDGEDTELPYLDLE